MFIDWLQSLRTLRPRRHAFNLEVPTLLEPRTLLSSVPVGPEFQVNTYSTNDQPFVAIAMDADGDYVITWASVGQDGDGHGVYAQRYNSAGVPQGEEFQVNTYTTNWQKNPRVAMDAQGDFVITWESRLQDGSYLGVYAQRYDHAGIAQGTEFRVNTTTSDSQSAPSISMDEEGDFVIAWRSFDPTSVTFDDAVYDIYAQRYNAAGVPQGSEFRVNTYTTNDQILPAVAMDRQGKFVITWYSNGQEGSQSGIYAQRFNSDGVPQGSEFHVNTYTTWYQNDSQIAMDADGNFVIVWTSVLQDKSDGGIYGQRYDATGSPLGNEFRVNTYTSLTQQRAKIAMDADGDFVVTWMSKLQDGSSYGIYAQKYNKDGTPAGSEFQVNTYTTSLQGYPEIAMDTDGDFVIAWQSVGQDGAGYGNFAQRYRTSQIDNAGVWRSSKFYLDSNHSNNWNGTADDTLTSFGSATDRPLVGDWNGDGYDEIGIWRSGAFYLDANGNGIWDGPAIDQKFSLGNATDTPLVGDWNHDGKDETGFWRAGKFYLDLDGNHAWNSGFDAWLSFGSATDTPIIGDWNGDGTDDIGIWRAGKFYLDLNGNHAWNSADDGIFTFGNSTDTPLIGDWNGDGTDDIGIWRAGKFYKDADGSRSWNASLDSVMTFGSSTDAPLIGYWRPKTVPVSPPPAALLPLGASPTTTSESAPSPAPAMNPENLASLIAVPPKKLIPRD